jgi:hypothetical protein
MLSALRTPRWGRAPGALSGALRVHGRCLRARQRHVSEDRPRLEQQRAITGVRVARLVTRNSLRPASARPSPGSASPASSTVRARKQPSERIAVELAHGIAEAISPAHPRRHSDEARRSFPSLRGTRWVTGSMQPWDYWTQRSNFGTHQGRPIKAWIRVPACALHAKERYASLSRRHPRVSWACVPSCPRRSDRLLSVAETAGTSGSLGAVRARQRHARPVRPWGCPRVLTAAEARSLLPDDPGRDDRGPLYVAQIWMRSDPRQAPRGDVSSTVALTILRGEEVIHVRVAHLARIRTSPKETRFPRVNNPCPRDMGSRPRGAG